MYVPQLRSLVFLVNRNTLTHRIWLHESWNVTKVLVNPSFTFIVLSTAKQKNNFFCHNCSRLQNRHKLLLHPVKQTQDSDMETKLLLNSAWGWAIRHKGRWWPGCDLRMGVHHSVDYFKILFTRWTAGAIKQGRVVTACRNSLHMHNSCTISIV